jgi:hypothetical protein
VIVHAAEAKADFPAGADEFADAVDASLPEVGVWCR